MKINWMVVAVVAVGLMVVGPFASVLGAYARIRFDGNLATWDSLEALRHEFRLSALVEHGVRGLIVGFVSAICVAVSQRRSNEAR